MQKKILIAIFAILSMALVATFVLIFQFGDSHGSEDFLNPEPSKNLTKEKESEGWTKKLANVNRANYHFPVNDLFIKIDLKQKKDEKSVFVSYELVVEDFSRYSLFCVRQVLHSSPLSYIVMTQKDKQSIVIKSTNKNSLDKISEQLKKYEVKSKIKEVKNEKNRNM